MGSSDPGTPSVEASDAGWSELEPPVRGEAATETGGVSERYTPLDEVGAGGMGRVLSVLDRRLGREVAWKELPLDGAREGADRRLAREAAITARLEHPGIVPVYDTGVDGHRRYYTMRLVHGRTLGQAIADAPQLSQRLSLLPHALAACQAVAFAHSRGVVHRDLKPDNIMVGGYGQTFVVDWGLADFATAEARAAAMRDLTLEGTLDLRTASGLGTAAWVSPEQARSGAAPAPRADVFGLGAVLYALLTGRPPRPRAADLADVANAPLGDPIEDCPDAPIELRAVVARALSADPEQRYTDAGALASDLALYLEGRRVTAHAYTPWQLTQRFVRTWRAPLLVAVAALVGLATLGVVALNAAEAELDAERVARQASDRAASHLAWALRGRAVAEARAGAWPEAAIVGAEALLRQESPTTRGVLAAAMAALRPAQTTVAPLPTCDRLSLAANGTSFACARGAKVSLHTSDTPATALFSLELDVDQAVPTAHGLAVSMQGHRVRLYDRSGKQVLAMEASSRVAFQTDASGRFLTTTNRFQVHMFDTRTLAHTGIAVPCGERQRATASATATDGRVAVACASGRLRVFSAAGTRLLDEPIPFDTLRPAAVATFVTDEAGEGVVVGGIKGRLAWLPLTGSERATVVGQRSDRVESVVAVGRPGVVAVTRSRGGVELWNAPAGTLLGRLPRADRRGLAATDGEVITAGRSLTRWRLPERIRAQVFRAPAGLSHLSISRNRRLLAAGRGDGVLNVWDLDSGRLLAERRLAPQVVKWGDFDARGGYLAAVVTTDGARRLAAESFAVQPGPAHGRSLRRVGLMASGMAFGLPYAPGIHWWKPGADAIQRVGEAKGVEFRTSALTSDRTRAFLLSMSGEVHRLNDAGKLARLGSFPGAMVVAAHPAGGALVARSGGLARVEATGVKPLPLVEGDEPTALAVSPTGQWYLVGRKSGPVSVVDAAGRLVAELDGHADRVVGLRFVDGETLLTASWDHTVRRWDMSVLGAAPETLLRRLENAWGRTLDTFVTPP